MQANNIYKSEGVIFVYLSTNKYFVCAFTFSKTPIGLFSDMPQTTTDTVIAQLWLYSSTYRYVDRKRSTARWETTKSYFVIENCSDWLPQIVPSAMHHGKWIQTDSNFFQMLQAINLIAAVYPDRKAYHIPTYIVIIPFGPIYNVQSLLSYVECKG